MKKIFTFLVAFLTTLSGAVWGQTYDLEIDLSQQQKIYEVTGSGSYRFYGENNHGIIVDRHSDATITLDGVTINVVEAAINLQGGSTPTFLLKGENIINSQEGPAIRVARDAESVGELRTGITFSEQSTGSLVLNVNGNVAIGNSGLTGDVVIKGGTIVTDGKISDGTSMDRDFTMEGNAVIVCSEIDWTNFGLASKNLTQGILFEKSTTGQMYGNVTLKSPLDLTDNDLTDKLDLRGGTLTIGNGQVLKANEKDITNGSIVGFAVKYEENRIEGCNNAGGLSSDYNFYGEGAKVVLPAALACSTEATSQYGNHQFLGWADDSKVTAAESEYTTGTTANTYTASESGEITGDYLTLKGAWAVDELTLNVTNNTAMTARKLASTPDFISYGTVSDGLPTGISFKDNTLSGTPNVSFEESEQTKTFTVNVPVTGSGVAENTTAVITIVVSKDKPDLSTAEVSIAAEASNYVYDNTVKSPLVIKAEGLETPLVERTHYTVTYGYKVDETAEEKEVTEVKEAGIYTVKSITNTDATQGEITDASSLGLGSITVNPRTLNVRVQDQIVDNGTMPTLDATAIVVTDNTSDVNDYWAKGHNEATITFTGAWDMPTVPTVAGEYELTPSGLDIASITSDGDQTHNYKLGSVTPGVLTVVVSGSDEQPINPGEPDKEDDEDVTIRVKGDGWTVADGAYQHVYTGEDLRTLLKSSLEAKQFKTDGTYDWKKIPAEAITEIEITSYKVDESSDVSTAADEVKNAGLYSLMVTIDSDKAEGLLYDGVVSPLPVRVTPRDLSINIYLDGLTKDDIGKQLDPNNDLLWEYENGEDIGLVYDETPIFSGYIRISNTMNSAGKYDVYYSNIDIEDEGEYGFLKSNYNPIILINETDIELGQEEEELLPGGGIEIDDDDSGSDSGSGITTKRYQLYLANKDYNVKDAKEDYAAEGLELFSRHNKKYTNAGSSFTVWYEKDGVANAGGYRIFWSNRANGEYKEVKFDTVSKYFQIRNVQSDVYVKIYAADGFPVGNEEISAADYRAYAQPNKIVVITPQPTDVQIISMAGAVVATDKVTGQREFANLTEGVYIVRMGETVVKLQVRK